MIGTDTFEEMRRRVGEPVACWLEEIVPEEVTLLPSNAYSPRYAWMFAFEKRWKYRVEEALGRPLGALERLLLGADGAISETLSNAYVHGNRRNALLPISVTTVLGQHSLALRITDQGQGFDVARAIAGLERGSTYFHVAGNGLRALARSSAVTAGFEARGRAVALYVPLSGEPGQELDGAGSGPADR